MLSTLVFSAFPEGGGTIQSDILTITIDDQIVFSSALSNYMITENASYKGIAHDITNNLAATATIAADVVTLRKGKQIEGDVSFAVQMDATTGANDYTFVRGYLKLNSYCARHLLIQYSNVQAAKDSTINGILTNDRPIESKYSVDTSTHY